MRTFFIFLIGVAAGAFGFYYLGQHRTTDNAGNKAPEADAPTAAAEAQPGRSILDQARDEAHAAKEAIAHKLDEWHLTPEEIRGELSRTGQVVRSKAKTAGHSIAGTASNARIIGVIKAKYAIDSELSARAIEVECTEGHVTLKGTVSSHNMIARAVATALETDGVVDVKSLITVAEPAS